MKYNINFLVYVGNTIITGTNKQSIEREIKSLGFISDDHRNSFMLRLYHQWTNF